MRQRIWKILEAADPNHPAGFWQGATLEIRALLAEELQTLNARLNAACERQVAKEVRLARIEREEKLRRDIGMLRQWLNEEVIRDAKRFVTNEDLGHWLLDLGEGND